MNKIQATTKKVEVAKVLCETLRQVFVRQYLRTECISMPVTRVVFLFDQKCVPNVQKNGMTRIPASAFVSVSACRQLAKAAWAVWLSATSPIFVYFLAS